MPKLGEIKRALEVGGSGGNKKIWHACSFCGVERWVFFKGGQPLFTACRHCRNTSRKFRYPQPAGTIENPVEGDIRAGNEVGRIKTPNQSFIWRVCLECNHGKWINLYKGQPQSTVCTPCALRQRGMIPAPPPLGTIANPMAGDVRRGEEIGKLPKNKAYHSYIWHPCPDCGEAKWVSYRKGMPNRTRCKKCADRHHRIVTAIPKGTIANPIIGDVRAGSEVGFSSGSHHSYMWKECPNCGTPCWRFLAGMNQGYKYRYCKHCETLKRRMNKRGYLEVGLRKGGRFSPMAKAGYGDYPSILEHRLIMAKHLGRCLFPWEAVHHKNGVKDDNRIENLELTTNGLHIQQHNRGYQDGYLKGLEDGRKVAVKAGG